MRTKDSVPPAYRIGWWTHSWWPTWALVSGLVSGNLPSTRVGGGGRFVGRRQFLATITRRVRLLRRPHRPWQAEAEGVAVRFARRALTATGAERKILRDVEHLLMTGSPSFWQRRRSFVVKTRCRVGWHRMYNLRAGRACLSCDKPARTAP